jgi:hypothetical protein
MAAQEDLEPAVQHALQSVLLTRGRLSGAGSSVRRRGLAALGVSIPELRGPKKREKSDGMLEELCLGPSM